MIRTARLTLIALAFSVGEGSSAAADGPVDFVRDVRPIFESHCYECHGEKKQKSGLRLDVKSVALKGGDKHGPDIVPGKAAGSPLIHFLTTEDEDELMPPDGPLEKAEIAMLTRWIEQGAVWPDDADLVQLEDRTDHWSFKPLSTRPADPRSLDDFIDAKLKEKGLHRSPPAPPIDWLRRVTFDLTGLPPTPEQVEDFAANPDKEAVVERLLSSPRYGERWAQHWLDVVRYADTHGFEVNTERPNAWPYRDYVIRAFNSDTPYDQFIREQMAGDACGQDAATGFLVTASVLLPGQIGKDEPSKRLARQDSLDEIVTNIGQTFLGLSVGCARCHDHKFDPISTEDYYSMQAFVAGVEYADRDLHTPEAEAARLEAKKLKARLAEIDRRLATFVPLASVGVERPKVNPEKNTDRFQPIATRKLRFQVRATMRDNFREPCIDELEVFNLAGENVALAAADAGVTSSGDIIVANRHDLKYLNDGEYGNSRSWMSNEKGGGWVEVEFAKPETIDRVIWGRDRQGKFKDRLATAYAIQVATGEGGWKTVADSSDRLAYDAKEEANEAFSTKGLSADEVAEAKDLMQQRAPLEKKIATATNQQKAFAGTFRDPDDIHVLNRGDPEQPQSEVVPAVLRSLGSLELKKQTAEQQRRITLADWIARPDNPLTARVMVNRIWQGHFGVGLVETSSDFGRNGVKPTHPELLDWLAAEFIRSGWSVKHLHRAIVLSETYGQASASSSAEAEAIDAGARLLWRFPSRRLEAESIRDSMLAVSGLLDLKMFGRGYDLFDKRGGLSGFKPVEKLTPENQRRMIYAHKVRRETEAVFGAFDCPDAGQSTSRRVESTTPIQALNLFNSPFTLQTSEAFAERVQKESGDNITAQITRAYRLALNRDPTREELPDALPIVQQHGLATLCRALFNSNEFLFVP
ncbi:MAG: PSD1 domain-containing protein [Verrucomicrobiales bacterium]|nr:PSD1 domain-containing protein [Verrucomicrobiales bacterium]